VTPFISVIIPNHNGEKTIGRCLEAVFASQYPDFEVIVVDDCSTDGSVPIIEKYPCRLIRLPEHGGASKARNTGAAESTGEVLFFIDADCLLQNDTIGKAAAAYWKAGPDTVLGGTYTLLPYDRDFFSTFQSVYIHYSETKNPLNPDYIATHALIIAKDLFCQSGGFAEDFMPILEDVDFSHRLKKREVKLRMAPEIQVQHIFNFSLLKSLRNAVRKTKYWSLYSLKNKDLFADSGTASQEFKFNVLSCLVNILLGITAVLLRSWYFVLPVLPLFGCNIFLNRYLIKAFRKTGGSSFATQALLYYTLLYPLAVGLGACSAVFSHYSGFFRS
jgi:glycosyltransferase involved in cell wall biosynthesis